jgi:hypothetical protein
MSRIRADKLVNRTASGAPELTYGASVPVGYGITGAGGINVTGVVTATSFSGNLTGNVTGTATTATLATNAQGLTGSPSITVAAINNTGISTISDLRLASVSDKVTVVTGTGVTLAYNSGGGNVAVVYNASGPITLNVTGVPTTSDFNDRSLNFAVIVRQGTTGYGCSSLVLNGVTFNSTAAVGVSTRISYPSGTVSTASTSGYDIFNFIGINTTGSASTMTNYNFISIKNGDFRFY